MKQISDGLYNQQKQQLAKNNSFFLFSHSCKIEPIQVTLSHLRLNYTFRKAAKSVLCSTISVDDTDLSALTSLIAHQLKQDKEHIQPSVTQTDTTILQELTAISQRIHFNLIRQRGVNSNMTMLKLFKSFISELKMEDLSLVVLPF